MQRTDDFAKHSIPESGTSKTALDYHQIPIYIEGILNKEPLVDVSNYKIASDSFYCKSKPPYNRSFGCALTAILARETVAAKLAQVNQLLQSYEAELLIWDGWRPIELQRELWDYFIDLGKNKLGSSASEDELVNFAGIYCSDPRNFNPDDYRTWPVHNTGGAVDLTLRSLQSQHELFMGTGFDHAGPESAICHYEAAENLSSEADREARNNRRLLYHAMTSMGFSNYSYEWWHYDYGTQMWAMNTGADHAFYGRAE